MPDRFTGLVAAAFTPMHADGALNLDAVASLAEHFLATDVAGVFVAGTTGESHSLTVDERLRLAERWRDVVRGTALKLIVHVGHNCQADAVTLTKHAGKLEVDGVSALAPSYFKPTSAREVVEWLAPVAGAAPEVPFYYYHIPPMTGLNLPLSEIVRLSRETLPSYAGFKFSSQDLEELQASTAADPAGTVFYGTDQILLAAWSLGVQAAVGSTYNFAAPLYHRILEAAERGDFATARQEQSQSVQMVRAIGRTGCFLGTAKALMSRCGVDCGPVRAPLKNPSPGTLRDIVALLDSLDVLAPAFR